VLESAPGDLFCFPEKCFRFSPLGPCARHLCISSFAVDPRRLLLPPPLISEKKPGLCLSLWRLYADSGKSLLWDIRRRTAFRFPDARSNLSWTSPHSPASFPDFIPDWYHHPLEFLPYGSFRQSGLRPPVQRGRHYKYNKPTGPSTRKLVCTSLRLAASAKNAPCRQFAQQNFLSAQGHWARPRAKPSEKRRLCIKYAPFVLF